MKLSSALGGLAGAATLTILNESVKKLDKNAPHMDLLGLNAVAKVVKGPGGTPLNQRLKPATVAGDILSNSLYFGMANAGDKKNTFVRGALLGLGAGVGAIALTRSQSPEQQAAYSSTKTRALTIAWYVLGGLVAAAVINLFDRGLKD